MKGFLDKVSDMVVSGAKGLAQAAIDTVKAYGPWAIPGTGYFVAAGDKIPQLATDEKVLLASAFGAATMIAVDAGQEVGQKLYEGAFYLTRPDESNSRMACFASNLTMGVAGAAVATTVAFNTINEHGDDIANFFENPEPYVEQLEEWVDTNLFENK